MDWIPVTERLPELWQRVLGFKYGADIELVCYVGLSRSRHDMWNNQPCFRHSDDCLFEATHWMPLPELPTVDATTPVKEGVTI